MKIKQIIFAACAALISIAARAGTPGVAPTCPPQASAAGFTNPVFDEEFATNDVTATTGTTTISGMNWYPWNWEAATSTSLNTSTHVLTVTGGNIATMPTYAAGGKGAWSHGYFEARIQFTASPTSYGQPVWPAFWAFGTNWYSIQPATHPQTLMSEVDIYEGWPYSTTVINADTAIHTWQEPANSWAQTDIANNTPTSYAQSLVGSTASSQPDGQYHTYGVLWVQTSATAGYLEFYLDNYLISHQGGVTRFPTGSGTSFTAQEIQPMLLILQASANQSINVDWVHVWQTGTAVSPTAQTVSGFPSTLSLTTAQSPYTLPANTSAGLPITYSVTSGPATVSGNTLSLTGAGSVVVKASQAGNATYSAYSATETITVTALTAQTVSGFPATLGLTTDQSPYSLPATTSAGLALTYKVASGSATVSGSSLTLTGTGTVVLNASQTGNSTYAAYSGSETITVSDPGTQTLSGFPSTLSLITTQSPYSLPATTSAGLTVTYAVVSGPATVSGHTLTLTGPGTVVLNASQAGNAAFAAYAGTETISVAGAEQTVSNFPATLSLSTTQSPYSLPATTSAGLSITYSVTSGTASVSGDTLALSGAGTVVLHASQAGNSTYASYAANETITVTAPTVLTAQTVANFPSTLDLSMTQSPYTLPATTSAGLPIAYSVVSGSATVSGNTLTLAGPGSVMISASQAGNSTYSAYSGAEAITVAQVSQTVTGLPSALSLSTTQSPYTLPATTSAGLTLAYSVKSGPATVSGHTLTITGQGTVVINATQAGNATYSSFSGTETITVSDATQTVASLPATQSMTTGGAPVSLPATTSAGLPITYSVVSGPASISGDTLTITGAGTVVLSATQAGNSTYAAFSTTETITVSTAATTAATPATETFTQWEAQSGSFNSTQMSNAAVSGATATPQNDGVPNLLKYVYDINPAVPMTPADYAVMPSSDVDTTTTEGTTYLTLTYREYAKLTGVTVSVQTSPDLQTWTTVKPDITRKAGTDPNTSDPIMVVEVNTKGAASEFIRLNVTSP